MLIKKKQKKQYKAETMSSSLNLIAELGNYAAVIATAVVTLSISIFVDLIDSTCNLLRTSFATILSKKLQKNLKFKYNYGTEKLETLITLFCDTLLILGTTFVFGFAIYRLVVPSEQSRYLLVGVIFKAFCVLGDIGLLIINYIVFKKSRTKVAKSNVEGSISSLAFDAGVFLSVLLAFFLTNWSGVVYIEPIATIFIAIFIIVRGIIRIKNYIAELSEATLNEQEQQKIAMVLAKYFSLYNEFYSANSHKIGETVFVDFRISFEDDKTFNEIKNNLKLFTEELNKSFDKCKVTFVIDCY